MTPYFFTFGIASLFLVNPINFSKNFERLLWVLFIIYGTIFIGLRYEVGGDWLNYLNSYEKLIKIPPSEWLNISRFDPGYLLLNLISSFFNAGIVGVNLMCGFITMTCLVFFASKQPIPWVTIVASIPFFIIGISMGTVRQGLALSFILVALTYIDKNIIKFLFWIIVASLFHKSGIIMLGLLIFKSKNIYFISLVFFLLVCLIWIAAQLAAVEILLLAYVLEPDYQSDGALIRIMVSTLPFLGSVLFYKEMVKSYSDYWVYFWIGIGTLFLLVLVSSFSTLVDRVAYYSIPLQLALWPRIISVQKNILLRGYFTVSFILGYLLMLFVWLVYANHSWAWIPYQVFWYGEYPISPSTLCQGYTTGFCH